MFFVVVTYKVENDEHEYRWELDLEDYLGYDTTIKSGINSAKWRFIEEHPEAISFKMKLEFREVEYIKTGDTEYSKI